MGKANILNTRTINYQELIGNGKSYREVKATKQGVQYRLDIPANGTALMVWDRIK